jgi:hypothetical protein
LPVEQIAALAIDPWWLDLFAVDPILKTVSGKQTRFNRLQNAVLAYRTNATNACVGVYDGQSVTWLEGDLLIKGYCSPDEGRLHLFITLTSPRISNRPAAEHLATYLKLLTSGAACEVDDHAHKNGWHPGLVNLPRVELPNDEPRAFTPRRLDQVQLGSSVRFSVLGTSSREDPERFVDEIPEFHGRMLELVEPMNTILPDCVNWVFDAFQSWNPIVFGAPLRNALAGRNVSDICVLVDDIIGQRLLSHVVRNLGGQFAGYQIEDQDWSRSFVRQGLRYHLWTEYSIIGGVDYLFAQLSICRSADLLIGTGPNRLLGSRIALHDASHGQARLLHPGQNWNDLTLIARKILPFSTRQLSDDGIRLLPTPGKRDALGG